MGGAEPGAAPAESDAGVTEPAPRAAESVTEADGRAAERAMGEQLARWGRVCLIHTVGLVSGRPAQAAVGFVDAPDGALLVAAGFESAAWALNLAANPRCRVTVGDRTDDRVAVRLEGADHNRAITELILRYGTPAERLGAGPAFRLEQRPDPGG